MFQNIMLFKSNCLLKLLLQMLRSCPHEFYLPTPLNNIDYNLAGEQWLMFCIKIFHCRNCLTKPSASLKIACSSPSPKLRELVLLDEASCDPSSRAAVVWPLDLALNGDGAPLRVKCLNNANRKLLCREIYNDNIGD